jgi:hypothetical protein
MQNVVFGIMIMGGQKVSMIGFLSKKHMTNDKFLLYKLIGNVVYPMQPWFYSPFKGEKNGLPRYKTHWNLI